MNGARYNRVAGFDPVELIPLDQAVLCENCRVISRGKNHLCLSCGSPSILHLANVLGREQDSISTIKPSPAEAELEHAYSTIYPFQLRCQPSR
jgi:hypothetical protein